MFLVFTGSGGLWSLLITCLELAVAAAASFLHWLCCRTPWLLEEVFVWSTGEFGVLAWQLLQRSCQPDQAAFLPRNWMDAKCGALALKEKVLVASGAGNFSAQSLFLFLVAPLYSVCATRSEVASHAFTCSSRLVAHWHCWSLSVFLTVLYVPDFRWPLFSSLWNYGGP